MKIAYSHITNNFYEYSVNYMFNCYQEFQENIKWVMQKPMVFGLFNFHEES
jgi:hypothetical protein